MVTDARPPCPSCGSRDQIEIVYGLPDAELGRSAERGEVVLGGCVIGPESPTYECRSCGAALPWIADDRRA
jgi:hypothetical protein